MSPQILTVVGVLLMAGCGSAIGVRIGLVDFETALVAGFAVGILLLGQGPALALRKRLVALEEQIAHGAPKDD